MNNEVHLFFLFNCLNQYVEKNVSVCLNKMEVLQNQDSAKNDNNNWPLEERGNSTFKELQSSPSHRSKCCIQHYSFHLILLFSIIRNSERSPIFTYWPICSLQCCDSSCDYSWFICNEKYRNDINLVEWDKKSIKKFD